MPAMMFNEHGLAIKHEAHPNPGDRKMEVCQSRQLQVIFKLISCFHFEVPLRHALQAATLELWYALRGEAAEKKVSLSR
jgi:hypothetical protein